MISPGFAEVPEVTLFVIQLLNWPLTAIKLINSLLIVAKCKSPKIDLYVLPIFPILVRIIIFCGLGKSFYFPHFQVDTGQVTKRFQPAHYLRL